MGRDAGGVGKKTDEEILTQYETQAEVYCHNLETNMTWEAVYKITGLQHSVFSVLIGNPKRPRITREEYRMQQRRLTRVGLKVLVCIHNCIGKLSKVKIRPEDEPWLYKGKPFSGPEEYMKDPKEIKAWRKLQEEVEFSRKIRSALGAMETAYKSMLSTLQLRFTATKEEEPEEEPFYQKMVDELVSDESLKRELWRRPFPRMFYVK